MQSRETHRKLKPNYPRPLLGVMGKGVSPLSLPVSPCPGLAEPGQSLLADFVLGAVLPLGACKPAAPQGWAMLFVSLPALPTSFVALREQSPRKGVSDHHLPCTLPVPSPSSHCFHHAPQSCYKRVSLHGNRHNDQGPGGFLHPGEFFQWFYIPTLRANSTLL